MIYRVSISTNLRVNKVETIKTEMMINKAINQPKDDEDLKIEEIINSKNDTAKNKKIKELFQKNKELTLNFEKERVL